MRSAQASLNKAAKISALERGVKIFISHSSPDASEALAIDAALKKHNYDVWQYETGLPYGAEIWIKNIGHQISISNFFLLLISDASMKSESVQRELGLAYASREEQRGFRPIIIPVYLPGAAWRQDSGARPKKFAMRDFKTNELLAKAFDLDFVRGHDPTKNPDADTIEFLLDCMKPEIEWFDCDAHDEEYLEEVGMFDMYERLFDEDVRASAGGFIQDMRNDNGQSREVTLWASRADPKRYLEPHLRAYQCSHISLLPILKLYGRAIAFDVHAIATTYLWKLYWRSGILAQSPLSRGLRQAAHSRNI